MNKIENESLIKQYYLKYNLHNLFNKDVNPPIELFLFKKSEHIFTSYASPKYILFFVEGKAKVYKSLPNGKSLLLCFYTPFMVLGDLELINPNSITSNVQALEDCYCLAISIDYARKHLLQDYKFLKYICSSLGEKLNNITTSSSINILYKLENKLAAYILATSTKTIILGKEELVFEENLTHLSELLGTSYRHLLRTLNMLCTNKILEKHKNSYKVINLQGLKDLSSNLYT